MLLVVAGVVLAAWPAPGAGSVLGGGVHQGYAALFVLSMLFPALDSIYKEGMFRWAGLCGQGRAAAQAVNRGVCGRGCLPACV